MGGGRRVPLALLALLSLGGAGALRAGHTLIQAQFYQRDEKVQQEGGEFLFDFDGDEIFHVDLQKTETVWRLPEFGEFAGFEAQGALQNMAVLKQNLEIMTKNSNYSRAAVAPPEVTVFSEEPVELGEPNVLICYVDKFWPSVVNITWLRNKREVTKGVLETVFYPRPDNSFRKFSYLGFVPARGDFYDCRVEHEGLPAAVQRHWEPQLPPPVSESTQTLVCALGLAVGVVGIVAGTVLIVKATKTNRERRDPL